MTRRPRILYVTDHCLGEQTGYGIRVSNTLAGLRSIGDVQPLYVSRPDGDEVWPEDGAITLHVDPESIRDGYLRSLRTRIPKDAAYPNDQRLRTEVNEILNRGWDLIWIYRARAFSLFADRTTTPVVVDLDDLYDIHYKMLVADSNRQPTLLHKIAWPVGWRIDAKLWAPHQKKVVTECDLALVVSKEDRDHLGLSGTEILPNGYPGKPDQRAHSGSPFRMLFVGGCHYRPNASAAWFLASEVLPLVRQQLPDAELLIVGRRSPLIDDIDVLPGVTAAGHVESVDPWYRKASVVMAPLRSGGGSRIKVVEAMARKLPLVATKFGIQGFALDDDFSVLIAETADSTAEAVLRIAKDETLGYSLSTRAHTVFVQNYETTVVANRTAQLASQVIEEASADGPGF